MRRMAFPLIAGLVVAGCVAPPKLPDLRPVSMKPVPTRMVVTITPSHLEKDATPTYQGMLCRIYFFAGEDPKPVEAHGALKVTAYDRAKNGDKPIPVGIFEIDSKKMPTHRKRDLIGTNYLCWLPYEPAKETQMVLQARFAPLRGAPFASNPVSLQLLPVKDGAAMLTRMQAGSQPASPVIKQAQYSVIDSEAKPASGVQPARAKTEITSIQAGRRAGRMDQGTNVPRSPSAPVDQSANATNAPRYPGARLQTGVGYTRSPGGPTLGAPAPSAQSELQKSSGNGDSAR